MKTYNLLGKFLNVTFNIPEMLIRDLLNSAIHEAHWIEEINPENGEETTDLVEYVMQGGTLNIKSQDWNGDLSLSNCADALQIMVAEYPQVLGNLLARDYDARETDIFLQLAVFCKVIY